MRDGNQRGFAWTTLALAGALVVSYAVSRQQIEHKQKEEAKAYGCLDAAQVTRRAEAICRAFAPEAGKFRIAVEKVLAHPNGKEQRQWHAECRDEKGQDIAGLRWDAETGELIQVNRPERERSKDRSFLSQKRSEQCAWDWFHLLGMASKKQRWETVYAVRHGHVSWCARYIAKGREAIIVLDAQTGGLMLARSWHTGAPPHNGAVGPSPRTARGPLPGGPLRNALPATAF